MLCEGVKPRYDCFSVVGRTLDCVCKGRTLEGNRGCCETVQQRPVPGTRHDHHPVPDVVGYCNDKRIEVRRVSLPDPDNTTDDIWTTDLVPVRVSITSNKRWGLTRE